MTTYKTLDLLDGLGATDEEYADLVWDDNAVNDWLSAIVGDPADPRADQARDALYSRVLLEPASQDAATARELSRLRATTAAKRVHARETTGDVGELSIVRISDIKSRHTPGWIVPGLFRESSLAGLAGTGGLGKSAFLLDIALCLTTGQEWFGKTLERKRVAYVAGEGVEGFKARIAAWEEHRGVTVQDEGFYFIDAGVNLSDDDRVKALADFIRLERIDFIVLDTLSQLAYLESENDNAQISTVLRNAKKLRDANPGASVVVVHHVNSEGTKARGGTAFRDNLDTLVMMRKTGNEGHFELSTKVQHQGKQKDGAPIEWGGYRLHEVANSAVIIRDEEAARTDQRTVEAERHILAALASGEVMSTATIRDGFDGTKATFNRTLALMVIEGRITKLSQGKYAKGNK